MSIAAPRPLLAAVSSFILLAGIAAGFAAPGPQDAKPAEGPAQAVPAAPTVKEGKVIQETVNPYGFAPKDSAVQVDAQTADLKQVLTDLGPEAIEWYQHVQTLSNPWFEGRAPGTEGHERAASYFEWWMQQIGLEPAFTDQSSGSTETTFRQPFTLTGREPKVKGGVVESPSAKLERGKDFAVLGSSGSGNVTAQIAFVGYGIKEGKDGYTSFDGDDDVKGRIAVVLRYEPLDENGDSRWGGRRFSSFAAMATKLATLAEKGAAAIVLINPPGASNGKTTLEDLRTSRWGERLTIPLVQVTARAADPIIRKADREGRSLEALRKLADEGAVKDFAMKPDVMLTVGSELTDGTVPATNVGGILRGRGELKDEWLVIGGHFDHVGYGMFGADPANRGKLHPGADDNASGSSGVLVAAKSLKADYDAAPADANLRSILFLAFSAEESGLDGSRHWVKNPTLKAESVNLMLNMDMIGRLRSDELSVGGVGTAKDFDKRLDPIFKRSGMTVHADPSGRGPSDHASFYNAGIPVLFFFTGTHDVYHKPGDKGYTVNAAGAVKVIRLVLDIAHVFATEPEKLAFQSSDGAKTPDRGYAGVRLGVMPAMGESDVGGVKVEAVSADTSAADAGIQKDDVLLTWDGKDLSGPGDMMAKLREHKPGDQVKILLRRDGKEMEVTVTLKASKPRE